MDAALQKVGQKKRRCCLTHVALICDKPDLHPIMPQLVIGDEAVFKAKDWDVLVAGQPRNVHLIWQTSAWSNASCMKWLIRKLGEALESHFATMQTILLMDACRVHLAPAVFSICGSRHLANWGAGEIDMALATSGHPRLQAIPASV